MTSTKKENNVWVILGIIFIITGSVLFNHADEPYKKFLMISFVIIGIILFFYSLRPPEGSIDEATSHEYIHDKKKEE